jgi:hypothetical protein
METQRKTARRAEQPRLRVILADQRPTAEQEERLRVVFAEPLLTPEQTAMRLGVTTGTLSVWRCTKRYNLAYIRCGSKIMYDARDVAAFEAARRKER